MLWIKIYVVSAKALHIQIILLQHNFITGIFNFGGEKEGFSWQIS